MGKVLYDPAVRYSEPGKRLYRFWKRIHTNSDSPEFKHFMGFYYWALKNGYSDRARLFRYDREDPYSPENCFWDTYDDASGIKETEEISGYTYKNHRNYVRELCWDECVNRIRRYYGMEPIHSSEV